MKSLKFFLIAALSISPAESLFANAQDRYVVVKGDTLWDVAEMLYGDPFQWVKIYEANKESLPNPHLIHPEQLLFVTGKNGEKLILKMAPAEEKEKPAEEIVVAAAPKAKAQVQPEAEAVPETMPEEPQEEKFEEPAAAAPAVKISRQVAKSEFKEYDGRVIVFGDPSRDLVSQGDVVFVDIGENQGLLPGDELLLVKKVRKAVDKKNRKKFWILENLGRLKVTSEVYQDRAACKVIFSHFPVNVGDGVLRIARGGR